MDKARVDGDAVTGRPLEKAFEGTLAPAVGRLGGLTLHDFADQVGEPVPGAGGGSVAAYSGSMAAALVDMVCQLTAVTKGAEVPDEELRTTCGVAGALRTRLLNAVDADAAAYLEVIGAHRLPTGTREEQKARDAAIVAATRHAAEVPLASAEACLEVLELARGLSAGFMTAAASELGMAVQAAMSGVRGAAATVATNLHHLGEDPRCDELRRRMAEIERRADGAYAAAWPLLRDLAAGGS